MRNSRQQKKFIGFLLASLIAAYTPASLADKQNISHLIAIPGFLARSMTLTHAKQFSNTLEKQGMGSAEYRVHHDPCEVIEKFNKGTYTEAIYGPLVSRAIMDNTDAYPIVQLPNTFNISILSKKASPITELIQLQGKTIASAGDSASVTLIFKHEWTKAQKKEWWPVEFKHYPKHDQPLFALLNDHVDAALMAEGMANMLAPAIRKKINVMTIKTKLPMIVVLSNKKSYAENDQFSEALIKFFNEQGKNQEQGLNYRKFTLLDKETLRSYPLPDTALNCQP